MSTTKSTNSKKYDGFTEEERGAMKERAKELKAQGAKADAERDVLAKIAEMSESDRGIAERLHAVIKANAPALTPKLWYGMPAYTRNGKIVCHFSPRRSSRRGTRCSASVTRRTSTRVSCGRPRSH